MRRIQIGAFLAFFALAACFSTRAASDARQDRTSTPDVSAGTPAMTPVERDAAAALFQDANDDRAAHHLPPLRYDPVLTAVAWRHVQRMVQAGTISHQLPGEADLVIRVQQAGVRCSTVAENIAEAPTARQIDEEWMHSAPHRANLLDPRVNAVGIAVLEQHGELFAVEDFARELVERTPSQQERQVASQLAARGLEVGNEDAVARAYCKGEPRRQRPLPRLVMRYSTPDLSRLPERVLEGLDAGRYRRAAVGACDEASLNGFAAYQMVILLY